jgi:hypothetical protein
MAETDPFEGALRGVAGLLGRGAGEQQRELDVLRRGEDRDQVEGLEDEAHRAGPVLRPPGVAHSMDVLAGDDDRALVDVVEAREAVQQGRLAGARRAHDRDELTLIDL